MSRPASQLDDGDGPRSSEAVPDLVFRKYRGEVDLPGMVDVYNGSREADGWDFYMTVEGMANTLANLSNTDPREEVLLAEVDGRIVGYGNHEWLLEYSGERVHMLTLRLLPSYRGRGIRRVIMDHLEARVHATATGHPPDASSTLSVWTCCKETSLLALLEARGFAPARHYFEMLRPLDEPIPDLPIPQGLEVRQPSGEEEYRTIFAADKAASQDEWGSFEPSERGYERYRNDPNFDPSMWVVAWDGDAVAGAVRNWIDEEENRVSGRLWGYTEDIFVVRPYRRRGLARALIARSLRMHADRGMTHANLGVDTENPSGALDLYTGLGYRMHKRYAVYRRALEPRQ